MTERLFGRIPKAWQIALAAVLFVILMADTVTTIRKLALTARLMSRLEEAKEELQLRAREELRERAEDVREAREEALDRLNERYSDLLEKAERHSRRFRNRYSDMESRQLPRALSSIKERGAELKAKLRGTR